MKTAHVIAGSLLLLGALLVSGCEIEDEDEVPNYGQVRLTNESAEPAHLFLGDVQSLTAEPGRTVKKRVGEEPQAISIRDDAGRVLFEQVVVIPDNTFGEYVVAENGQVYATAGNVKYPDEVGSRKEQVKIENRAGFPVELHGNGQLLAIVPAGLNATVDVPDLMLHVSIRRESGGELFQQILDIPKNAVISYVVTPDGSVIGSGGEVDPNEYYEYDGDYRYRYRVRR